MNTDNIYILQFLLDKILYDNDPIKFVNAMVIIRNKKNNKNENFQRQSDKDEVNFRGGISPNKTKTNEKILILS